jgi:hypothetical protein
MLLAVLDCGEYRGKAPVSPPLNLASGLSFALKIAGSPAHNGLLTSFKRG